MLKQFTMNFKRLLTILVAPLLLISAGAYAQNRTVSGVVTDASGAPLPGVTIVVAGTNIGTTTSASGAFELSVPPGSTLTVSYIGFATRQVPVTGGSLKITLQASGTSLNELVVIGYGTQKKKDLTGSIASVDAKDFQKGAITSPDQLIAGKISGVAVTSNGGAPGSGATIRIRGLASLNGNNDPLIVVDGVPLSNNGIAGVASALSLINPDDIENITVLKDASAAAIYGSRASSGVILITTKRGHGGKPRFDFNTRFSVSQISREVSVLTASQFRDYVNANGSAAYKAMLGNANTNWQNEIYQTALTTDNDLSISGALKNMPYRISVGYLDQEGILKTDNLQRGSAAVRLSPVLFDNHLKIDINLNGTLSKSRFANQGAIGNATQFDPTQPVHDTSTQFGGYHEWMDGSNLKPLATRNPVALLEQYHNIGTANRSFGNVQFDYKFHFLPDLHAILNLGYDLSQGKGTITIPANAAQSFYNTPGPGYNGKYLQKTDNTVGEFSLNYVKNITSIKSNINLTAGYGYYNNLTTNYSYVAYDAKGDTLVGGVPNHFIDKPENTLISYYGRLIYTFNEKYILTASLRTDGSSRFAPNDRWGTFPALAFAWEIGQEKFLRNSKTVSNLKLRLSYGVTGNQEGIGDYGYLADYYLSYNISQYQFGNQFYYMSTPSPYVSNLTWEQTASTNAGIDYGFFNNRITGSLDYYYKNTINLLDNVFIPVGSNFSNKITTNIGNMTSQGVEFSINAIPVQQKDLTWSFGFNVAYNKIKITKLRAFNDPSFAGDLTGGIAGATGQSIQIQTVGYSPFSFFVFKQVYDPKTGKPIEGLYEDLNRDGIINEKDQYRYKSPFAPVIYGFSTEVDYKKWSFSTVLRANVGNYMYNNVASNTGVQRQILNPVNLLVNATTDIYKTGFYNNQFQSDYYIQNASFLKMDNLSVGYSVMTGNKLNLRLTAYCQNVFTITKYTGLDPEIYGGIDNNFYPRPRIYTLGLNLGF